jgi:hypothetical protein
MRTWAAHPEGSPYLRVAWAMPRVGENEVRELRVEGIGGDRLTADR